MEELSRLGDTRAGFEAPSYFFPEVLDFIIFFLGMRGLLESLYPFATFFRYAEAFLGDLEFLEGLSATFTHLRAG